MRIADHEAGSLAVCSVEPNHCRSARGTGLRNHRRQAVPPVSRARSQSDSITGMKQPIPQSAGVETSDSAGGTSAFWAGDESTTELPSASVSIPVATSERPGQIAPLMLGAIGFLYFAQPVILPILLAGVAGMAVKPLIRWAFWCRLPAPVSAAIVLCVLVSALGVACFQMGRPAVTWLNEAPQHMTELRHRVQKLFPRLARFSKAAAVVNNFGATEDEQKQSPTVTLKTSRVPSSFNNWTGTSLAGGIEPLVLLYLLRASGDLFLQRQMRVMPTLQDKLSAVAIGREIQEYISKHNHPDISPTASTGYERR